MKKKVSAYAAAILSTALVLGTAVYATDVSDSAADSVVQAETEIETEAETEAETELVLDKPGIMYLVDTVKVHQEADKDSDTVGYCDRGSSVSILGILGDWYHVRLDQPAETAEETEAEGAAQDETAQTETGETEAAPKEGYIYGELLTDSPEEAQAAVDANDAEIARQQAAAAAAAAAGQSGGSGGGRSVVSRQKVADCDGGGGTIITTYSDGSRSTSRY